MLNALKVLGAALSLSAVLGVFVYIDGKVMSATNWNKAFMDRLFDWKLAIFYALIAPAIIYASQKVLIDNSKGSVWAVNICAALLLQIGGILATWLATNTFPNNKEAIALFIIFIVMIWSRS